MKAPGYSEIVCRRFCHFYKGGKDEMVCGTYAFLERAVTAQELNGTLNLLSWAGEGARPVPDYSRDSEIRALVCQHCDFLIDGCDYRQDRSGPPCGGYTIIEGLLK